MVKRKVKRKATPAQLRALAKGRARLKALRRGAKPTLKVRRRKNPGPPTRGAVMSIDLPGMTRATGQRRTTQQKIARKTLARYPKPKGQGGFRTNPPHYVIKGGKGFFDGAGWSSTKKGAAQYLSKTKAATIGQKIANATNKQVSVVPV